mgnify:CR=1 FL=1
MQAEPTTAEKLRGLPWSIAANATNTVMVQYTFFGSVFVLFLSALGLSRSQMGFLLALIPFFGLIALFVAPAVERYGYKRSYMLSFGLRAVIATGLLATPWVMNTFGPDVTLVFIAVTIAAFAMVRAVGVTASFPWVQEYVPNNVRGKYTATNNMVTTLTGFAAVTIGGVVLGQAAGLTGFMILLAVGVIFGFISVGLSYYIPGGAPHTPSDSGRRQGRELGAALRDGNFIRYLAGVGIITLVTVPLGAFLPLFMREQVGLSASEVVWLQTGSLAGTLVSSYLWGWAADRYGSIPVTLYGLGLRILLPLLWMFMPRETGAALYVALGIAFLQGVADMGWGIGSGRLLYVSVVPPEKRTDYMALYYAFTSIVGGGASWGGGFLLEWSENLQGTLWGIPLDPFVPLFIANLTLPILSLFLMRSIHEERGLGASQFAGIFLRGNPFLAMSSLIRFHLARDEHSTVLMTERLGQAKSPITVDELLEALEDPRFNVRFEAIISIARMPPDPRLREALVHILEGSELALTVVAAWALGRLGDPEAVGPLRRALDSDYRSVRAHAARALGALGAEEVAPLLLARLPQENDRGLQMAYASALGNLHVAEAAPLVIDLLAHMENAGARMELALTLARLIGDEHHFIRLVRQARADLGTAAAQEVTTLRRRLDRRTFRAAIFVELDACEVALARGDLDEGSRRLGAALRQAPAQTSTPAGMQILAACAEQLIAHGAAHPEYLILALHGLAVGRAAHPPTH